MCNFTQNPLCEHLFAYEKSLCNISKSYYYTACRDTLGDMKGGDMEPTLAVRLPNGELLPIPQDIAERYSVKAGNLTPYTRFPIVEFVAIPLDIVS